MTKKQHIARHKKLHAALMEVVLDWQACSPDGGFRITEKRSVRSLLEWSEKQLTEPSEVVTQTPKTVPKNRNFTFGYRN